MFLYSMLAAHTGVADGWSDDLEFLLVQERLYCVALGLLSWFSTRRERMTFSYNCWLSARPMTGVKEAEQLGEKRA